MTEHPAATAHRVAYLAGHGVGPEVTAAASRALDHLSRRHAFRIDEIHPPFGAETLTHSDSSLPPATRRAAASADAILVAGATEAALAALRSTTAAPVRVTRTLDARGDITLFAPLDDAQLPAAIARGIESARHTGRRLVTLGLTDDARTQLDASSPVTIEHRSHIGPEAQVADAPVVVIADRHSGDGLATELAREGRLTATGDLPLTGPGVFAPTHAHDHVDDGHGVSDPTEMLLATALLLAEGLGLRDAAAALEASVSAASRRPRMPTSNGTTVRETTKEFVDAVLARIPNAGRDSQLALGVAGMSVTR